MKLKFLIRTKYFHNVTVECVNCIINKSEEKLNIFTKCTLSNVTFQRNRFKYTIRIHFSQYPKQIESNISNIRSKIHKKEIKYIIM